MQTRKDKKNRKMRGTRTAGYGNTKGHRAAGQRGGRGNAGGHKHRWIALLINQPDYYGKRGFKRPQGLVEKVETTNVGTLDRLIERLAAQGLSTKVDNKYVLDLSTLGVDKLLGAGRVTHPIVLTGVKGITAAAREKIVNAGGSVETTADAETTAE